MSIIKIIESDPESFNIIIHIKELSDTKIFNVAISNETNMMLFNKSYNTDQHTNDIVIKISKRGKPTSYCNIIVYDESKVFHNEKYEFKLNGYSYFLGKFGNKVNKYMNVIFPEERHGIITMILHTHMPFIKHINEKNEYLEERWLHEAMVEVYFPLIHYLNMAEKHGVKLKYTISFSPTIMESMVDPIIINNFKVYLYKLLKLATAEVTRTSSAQSILNSLNHTADAKEVEYVNYNYKKFNATARYNLTHINNVIALFEKYGNILRAFKEHALKGSIELIVSAGTHSILPLLEDSDYIKAHLKLAQDTFIKYFGFESKGLWLPELGYTKGLDKLIKDAGYKYFFVDAHGVDFAMDLPFAGSTLKVYNTTNGIKVIPRNITLTNCVWDKTVGYPGHCKYIEFSKDIGFDLKHEHVKDFMITDDDNQRHHTGIKYHAVTDLRLCLSKKHPYVRTNALKQVVLDSDHHYRACLEEIFKAYEYDIKQPVLTEMFDTELFGHWWKEGPEWLYSFAKHFKGNSYIKMGTMSEAIERQNEFDIIEPADSSWGVGGYFDKWFNQSNYWYWNEEWLMEKKFKEMIKKDKESDGIYKKYMNQAFREILLFQNSDWIFTIANGSCVTYAKNRLKSYSLRFYKLYNHIINCVFISEDEYAEMNKEDSIFNAIEYTDYFN